MAKKKKTVTSSDRPAIGDKLPTLVVIDPNDATQEIVPSAGDVLTIEYEGKQKTFEFVNAEYKGEASVCSQCALDAEKNKFLCHRVLCDASDVVAKELVQRLDGSFVEKTDDEEEAVPELQLVEDDSFFERLESEEKPTSAEERRLKWEAALRELEKTAREYEGTANEYKFRAKQHAKAAEACRLKMFRLLHEGSENYVSETPLFDVMDAEEDTDVEENGDAE